MANSAQNRAAFTRIWLIAPATIDARYVLLREGAVMRLLTYYCGDHEAFRLFPNLAGPGLQVVITYESLPADPDAQRALLWDGRTVLAVHKRSERTIARVLTGGGTRLRWLTGTRSTALRDWRLIGTLLTVYTVRLDPCAPETRAMPR